MSADALRAHLAIEAQTRDAKWRQRFYDLVDETPLCERDPRLIKGPDDFPYFALDVPPPGATGTVTVAALCELATERGFGIALNVEDETAAWVFSYGDLVTRRLFSSYELPRIAMPHAGELRETLEILEPSETLFPPFTRPLLHQYFERVLAVERPGAIVLRGREPEPEDQLVFRFSRDDAATDGDFESAMAGIRWFFPRHVPIAVLAPEMIATLDGVFVSF